MSRGARAALALLLVAPLLQVTSATAAPSTPAGDEPVLAAPFDRGRTVHPTLAQAVPHVGAPGAWAAGATGAGKVIAVIDTGVNAGFGGTIIGSACFVATPVLDAQQHPVLDGNGDPIYEGHCGPAGDQLAAFSGLCFDQGVCDAADPAYVQDPAAGRPCPTTTDDWCAHGSAVAATAARHTAPKGVAPDASIYAVRVFDDTGTSADLVDVYYALLHVLDMAEAGVPIAAINLSLASAQTFPGTCDGDEAGGLGAPFHDLIGDLLAHGIAVSVAAGNSGIQPGTTSSPQGGLGFPACVSNTVSVGASDLHDEIAFFSNVSASLDLFAPGARTAAPGAGAFEDLQIPSGTGYSSWSGTSFSAPMVAAGITLTTQLYPKADVTQRIGFLKATGAPIPSGVPAATHPRLRLGAPSTLLTAGVLFPSGASLTASSMPIVGDFDGDGREDVFAYQPGAGADRIGWGTTSWHLDVRPTSVSGTYRPLVGQFRGPSTGPADILWYAPGSGADFLWSGQSSRTFASSSVSVGGSYTPVVGDFDGNGWDDVLWYAPGAAADWIWYGGSAGFTTTAVSAPGTWRVAVGDVDGDGRDDLLLHAPGPAADQVWLGSATKGAFTRRSIALNASYNPVVADVDGDADADVILYQPGAGTDYLWRGGPSVRTGTTTGGFAQASIAINGSYTPVVADLDGDHDDDVLWYAPGPAGDSIWLGRPTGPPTSRVVSITGAHKIVAGDLDAAAGAELVFTSSTSASATIWWSDAGAP